MNFFSDGLPDGVRRLFRLPPSATRRRRDLDDEIRFHVETHVERLRARGMSEPDARAAALARFGDADDLRLYCRAIAARREPWRRVRQWIDELTQDLRLALRQIRRAPAFTATAALILALGVGANTGVFSIIHHLLIAPLPFDDGNRMVMLVMSNGGGAIYVTPTTALFDAWRQRAHTVEQTLVVESAAFSLGDSTRGPTELLSGAAIPPVMFDFLGVHPLAGRPILASDTMPDATPVVLLGEDLWRRRFGASNDVLGRVILLDGAAHTVIGVVPRRFFMPFIGSSDAFVPMRHAGIGRATVFAKLRAGRSVADANRELAALFPPGTELDPQTDPPRVLRASDLVTGARRQTILLLFGAVGLVLLVACANVGNLLLARSWSRQREFSVRTALGAGRRRLLRQVLTESLMLSVIAGGLGIAFAFLVLAGIRAVLPLGLGLGLEDVHIDAPVILWSGGISALAGILFGMGPAFFAAGANAGESLRTGGRTSAGSVVSRRLRTGLIAGEIALSVVLLAGTGLLVRTLVSLGRVDVGFQPHGLVSARVMLTAPSLSSVQAREAAMRTALEAVRAIPGVRGALFSASVPPRYGIGMGGLEIEGRPTAPGDSLRTLGAAVVPPGFFAFTGVPILQGRTFSPATPLSVTSDDAEIIINESLARRFWPDGDALGARVRRGHGRFGTVVGIVGDIRLPAGREAIQRLHTNLQMYSRQPAVPSRQISLVVRSDLAPGVLEPAIIRALHDANSALVPANFITADALLARTAETQRAILKMIGAFALLALLLAGVGLHGVISYNVGQRTREIGVRIALGAQSAEVMALVIRQGIAIAAAGVATGALAAVLATRVLRSFLYGVSPGDPATLTVSGVALFGVALLALYAPARRAARLDPVEALRAGSD